MSLRGSLDTFALPDVLALLATTAKSGELHVSGAAGGGRVWVDRGMVTGAEAAGATVVVDVIVHLLRLDEGDFTFHPDRQAPAPGAPIEVAVALEQADARLTEWREVEQLLPSGAALLTLAPTASGTVRLSRDQWSAVAAVGEGRTVSELVEHLGGDELASWRLLANLVESGLVDVGDAVTVAPVRRTELAQQLSTLTVQAIAEAEAVSDESAPAGESDEAVVADGPSDQDRADEEISDQDISDEEEVDSLVPEVPASAAPATTADTPEGVSRGTLLKFLSSVRQ
jgi:hypothetical protein